MATKQQPSIVIPSRGERPMWTVAQLAAATQSCPEVISRKCRLRKIPSVKHGNDWRIPARIADDILDGKISL